MANPNSNRGRYNGRPVTINDIARREAGNQSDNEDPQNRLYTGNNLFVDSNPTGQPAGGSSNDRQRAQMLRDLMSQAAEQDEGGQAPSNFSGNGYTLGDEGVDRQIIRGEVTRHMTIWRNGLTLDDDGTFHELGDDPRQLLILQRLRQGIAPTEWLNVEPGQPVSLVLTDNSSRDYSPIAAAAMKGEVPKRSHFTGEGVRLDSAAAAAAAVAGSSRGTAVAAEAVPSSSSSAAAMAESADGIRLPTVDRSGQVLAIRLMLPSGPRTVEFNGSHSGRDLYDFVGQVEGDQTFELTTPPHEVVPRSNEVRLADLPDLRRGAVRFYRPK